MLIIARYVVDFFRWFFSVSGIQYTNKRPKQLTLFGRRLIYLNPLPGIPCRSDGPTVSDIAMWLKAGKVLKRHVCRVCDTVVWSWKPVKCCGSFKCFRKLGAWR